jgi:hypothetical protein
LVEHDLAKVGVAGSSPVFRSLSLTDYFSQAFFMPCPCDDFHDYIFDVKEEGR